MHTQRWFFTSLIISFLSCGVSRGTNALWLAQTPSIEYANVPLSLALTKIEDLSKRIDPERKGVHIVDVGCPKDNDVPKISLSMANPTVIGALKACMITAGLATPLVLDNVAFVGRAKWRYFEYTLHGKCVDAATRAPIPQFTIKYEAPLFSLSVREIINTPDGSYSCVFPVILEFLLGGDDVTVLDTLLTKNITFRVSAPGYKDRICQKSIFGDLNATSGYTIELWINGDSSRQAPIQLRESDVRSGPAKPSED